MIVSAVAAPAAGAGAEGLLGLLLILSFLFLLAMQQTWRVSIGWLFHKLADLLDAVAIDVRFVHVKPLGFVAHALRAASDNVYAALGYAALKTEHAGIFLFHEAWRMIRWTGEEIAALSTDTYHALAHVIEHDIPRGIEAGVKPIKQAIRGIDHTLGRLADLVYTELQRAAIGIDRLAHIAIHSIPAVVDDLIGAVEGVVGKLERIGTRTRSLERRLGAKAFTAAVATSLGTLGLRWLRCPALGRVGRRVGCGGFGLLEELMAASLVPFLLTDACRIVHAIERLVEKVEPEIAALVLGIEGFVCGGVEHVPSGIVEGDLKRVSARASAL